MDDVGTGEKGNTENPGTNTTLLTAPDVVADPANPADPGTVVNPVDPASADPAGPGAQPKGDEDLEGAKPYELSWNNEERFGGESEFETVKGFAKEHGLNESAANALLEQRQDLYAGFQEKMISDHEARADAWLEETKADPEFAGEKLNEHCEFAKRAINEFGGEEMHKILNETGYGNHPGVLRTFAKIGRLMQSDKLINSSSSYEATSTAEILYPNMTK